MWALQYLIIRIDVSRCITNFSIISSEKWTIPVMIYVSNSTIDFFPMYTFLICNYLLF